MLTQQGGLVKTTLILGFFIVAASFSTAAAQWQDAGKLNVWTTATVSRITNSADSIYLTRVRAAKNDGFDRIVFEFTGGMPSYQIEYVKSGVFENTGEQKIRVGGKAFLDVNLQSLPYPESKTAKDAAIPKGNQKLAVFNEIREIEWFEGVRDFGIGLNAKRQFRVQELLNPIRLVIDFKH